MDTFMYIKAENANSALMRDVKARIYEIERKFSRSSSESAVSKINSLPEGGAFTLDSDGETLLSKSLEAAKATGRAFNPCLGAVKDIWERHKAELTVPEKDEVLSALAHTSPDGLSLDGPYLVKSDGGLSLDFGAVAKGYAADEAVKILRDGGIENAMLNLGGNIAVIGESESNRGRGFWTIGIKNPFNTNEPVGTLSVSDCFVSVSGWYERYYEVDGKRYHHITDSETGFPAESGVASVAVISRDGTLADALSTALFVMGKEKALGFYESGVYSFEAVIVTDDGKVTVTDGLSDVFTFDNGAHGTDGTPLILESDN